MLKRFVKSKSLDITYFSVAVLLFLMILEGKNIIDIGYLCIVTYYYIRIKIHRSHTKYL